MSFDSTIAPSWLVPSFDDWPACHDVASSDILVQQGPSPEHLDLANFDYGELDTTLWAIIDDRTPPLDISTGGSSSTASLSAFGGPLAFAEPHVDPSFPPVPSLTTPSSTSRPLPRLPSLPATSSTLDTSPIYDPEACWAAVVSRDRTAQDLFIYAVSTTKIACRPSCSARRPLRANVRFYSTLADAESAGFRPCMRCRPDGEDPAEKRQVEAVEKAKKVIRERVEGGGKIGLEELARTVELSAFHLHRTFRKRVGVTPEGFAKQVKAEVASRAAARGVAS